VAPKPSELSIHPIRWHTAATSYSNRLMLSSLGVTPLPLWLHGSSSGRVDPHFECTVTATVQGCALVSLFLFRSCGGVRLKRRHASLSFIPLPTLVPLYFLGEA